MSELRRIRHRTDIEDIELDSDREDALRRAFEATEPGEYIADCVAATLLVDGDLNDSGVVVSTSLHRDRVFDLVSSFSHGDDVEDDTTVYAAATVEDRETGDRLSAHVTKDRILLSCRNEGTSFQSFRDYVLFLENSLHVTLTSAH